MQYQIQLYKKRNDQNTSPSYEDQNRNRAIEFQTFQKRLNDIKERLKDIWSLLLTQSALTEHQTYDWLYLPERVEDGKYDVKQANSNIQSSNEILIFLFLKGTIKSYLNLNADPY